VFEWPKKIIALCDREKVRVFGFGIRLLLKFKLCFLWVVENGSFIAYSQIQKIGIRELIGVDAPVLISHISSFLQEALCPYQIQNTNFVRYI